MTHLTTNERYQIEHDLRLGLSTAQIAQAMGRSIRTIQRELSNNGGRHAYDARQAIDKRRERARISSKNHPSIEDAVWEKVLSRVKCKLSPDQAIVVESLSISISAVYRHHRRCRRRSGQHRHRAPASAGVAAALPPSRRPRRRPWRGCGYTR